MESGQDGETRKSKVAHILGVKKDGDEVQAVVRLMNGEYELVSTKVLIRKCPKVRDFFEQLRGKSFC